MGNEYTDEFRRVQEKSRNLSEEEVSKYHREGNSEDHDPNKRGLGAVYAILLTGRTARGVGGRSLKSKKHGTAFKLSQVNGSLFYDLFEMNSNYLKNGELIDLHDDYSACKGYLSKDGLCGFAIEPDGNLVSVFPSILAIKEVFFML